MQTHKSETSLISQHPPSLNVSQFIDNHPFSGFQKLTVLLCFLIVLVDGIDLGLAAHIAPAVRREWSLSVTQLSPVFVAGLFGMMIGALTFGPLADRWGRRPTLLASVAVFGVTTLFTLLVQDVWELAALRFCCGIGIGAATPIAATLTAEVSPIKRRLSMVTMMVCGHPLGVGLGGIVASQLISRFGWHSMLVFGGVAPLVLFPILWLWLPESMRFIALKRPHDQMRLREMAQRIVRVGSWHGTTFTAAAQPVATRSAVGTLLVPQYRRGTLLLWITFFIGLAMLYLMTSWLPTIMTNAGISLKTASLITAAWSIGGTCGGLLLGRAMDRFSPHLVLASAYALACLLIFAMGQSYTQPALLAPIVFFSGFCISGSQTGLAGLATALYPTGIRATGVTWANGIGRTGSMLGSAIGGLLLTSGLSYGGLFAVVCAPALVASLCMSRMSRARSAPVERLSLHTAQ